MAVEADYIAQTVRILSVIFADASFWVGLVAVVVFSWSRFNERQFDDSEIDPPVLTRSFTTRFRYHLAALTYTASYGLIYLLLIVFGSFPFSQHILISLIGTIDGQDIGTPAWAAMVTTAILPAFKLFKGADQRLRMVLQDFASIPLKARRLAEEIVAGATVSGANGAELYDRLRHHIDRLKTLPKLKKQQAYAEFFARYKTIQDNLDKQRDAFLSAAEMDDKGSGISPPWEFLTNRLARLIACSVLQTEPDEFAARRVLKEQIGNRGVPLPLWKFTNSQIVLAVFTVLIAPLVGLFASSVYMATTFLLTESTNQLVWAIMRHAFSIIVLSIPMFVLPLVYAAGVQMYLLDREELGNPLEWHEELLARIFTFCMAYGLALLPLMIVAAIGAHRWDGGSVNLLIWAPWAIPPASVATLFVIASTVKGTSSPMLNAVIDFVLHAAVAFLTSYVAMLVAASAGFKPDLIVGVPPGTIAVVAPITAAFTGGVLGALQCSISRRSYAEKRKTSDPKLQMLPEAGKRAVLQFPRSHPHVQISR